MNYLWIADYHCKFSILKRTEGLPTDNFIKSCKIVFAEYGLPNKMMSDAGTIFL